MRFSDNDQVMFTPHNIQMIKESAFMIIEKIGMRVIDETVCRELLGSGLTLVNRRFTASAEMADSFLDNIIKKENESKKIILDNNDHTQIHCNLDGWINNYPHSYYDPETNQITPYDTNSLIKMTAFCNRVGRKFEFSTNVPGYPKDVPPICEAISRYVVGNKYLDKGTYPEPMGRYSAKYLFEMSNIMGHRISSLPLYLSTPLTLGDESFFTILENQKHLDSVHVCSMPSFGANTPLSISGSIALILAEDLLGAIIIDRLTGLDTYIGISLQPFDFKDINQTFGTPEKFMLHWICHNFCNILFDRSNHLNTMPIHTQTMHPDAQASGEKAMAMVAGYMKLKPGESLTYRGMGILGMDEIFSPAQLLIDAELLQYMRRIDAGYEIDQIPDNFIDEIYDGIDTGFISSDRTVSHYKNLMYHSNLFTRANLNRQQNNHMHSTEKRAAIDAKHELIRESEMVLESNLAEALDILLKKAIENAN